MSDFKAITGLESQITKEVQKSNGCTVHFKYERTPDCVTVKVFTFNPISNEFFLLDSAKSSKASAIHDTNIEEYLLGQILEYVRTHKQEFSSYTVVWCKKDDPKNQITSYFYCKNAKEVADKFYDGKDPDAYVVYKLELNPIA